MAIPPLKFKEERLMTAEEFIKRLADLMDTDAELKLSTKLADVEEWDSLSMVSFY